MSDDVVSERVTSWAPEEVDALFDAARQARLTARGAMAASRQAMQRREDAHDRYRRVMAEVQRAYPTGR